MSRPLAVICLAAGMGKRTKVSMPKVLLPLCGRTLASSAMVAAAALEPERAVVVLHNQKEKVQASLEQALAGRFARLDFVDQGAPKGTGHAVQVGMQALDGFVGDVIVIYGDCPLMTAATLSELRSLRGDAACSSLTAYPDDATGMGRILRDAEGRFVGIREHKDCSEEELGIDEINCGFYCFDSEKLRPALANLQANNAQGELYLTDVIADFVSQGELLPTMEADDIAEVQGVNSLADLAVVQRVMQERILLEHLGNGVLILDPSATWIDQGVEIGGDTVILPGTVIGAGCRIDNMVQIGHNVRLGRCCVIVAQTGIAGSTVLEDFVVVGGQVGIAGHLNIGEGANIGAQSGVMKNLPAGARVLGSPAVPARQFMRQTTKLARLALNKGEG